jgi:hypothetical protein
MTIVMAPGRRWSALLVPQKQFGTDLALVDAVEDPFQQLTKPVIPLTFGNVRGRGVVGKKAADKVAYSATIWMRTARQSG